VIRRSTAPIFAAGSRIIIALRQVHSDGLRRRGLSPRVAAPGPDPVDTGAPCGIGIDPAEDAPARCAIANAGAEFHFGKWEILISFF
jgi:hypothetical protein